MRTHVRHLLLLQEIDSLLGALAESADREAEESLGFTIGPLSATRARRAETAARLDPALLRRYEQVRRRHARAVAPVRRGVCLGCFTKLPTLRVGRAAAIETCERCGRLLFRLEESAPGVAAPPRPLR